MGLHGTRLRANDCFYQGLSIEETSALINMPMARVKTYYSDFIVSSAKSEANKITDRLLQIRAIERELFERIKNKKPTFEQRKEIDELQKTYQRFVAL